MSDLSSVGQGLVGSLYRNGKANGVYLNGHAEVKPMPVARPVGSFRGEAPSDRVELSRHSHLLEKLREMPDVRPQLVEKVRSALASNAYESPDKLDATVTRLLEDLGD